MKYLLDTHVLVWCDSQPHLLSPAARAAILDPAHEKFFSAASIWELAVKLSLGKLTLNRPLAEFVSVQASNAFDELPIPAKHCIAAESFALIH